MNFFNKIPIKNFTNNNNEYYKYLPKSKEKLVKSILPSSKEISTSINLEEIEKYLFEKGEIIYNTELNENFLSINLAEEIIIEILKKRKEELEEFYLNFLIDRNERKYDSTKISNSKSHCFNNIPMELYNN